MSGNKLLFVVVGYSGHGLVIAEAAMQIGHEVVGYIDVTKKEFNPFSLTYKGTEDTISIFPSLRFILGIGDNFKRQEVAEKIVRRNGIIGSIIHPDSSISKNTEIGEGTFVGRNASVNTSVRIGKNVIINTGSIVEHECKLDDGVHIAPGAVLAGNVMVGKHSFIGANSIVKQGVTIGENVIVGAGSVVLSDIKSNQTFVGNPARPLTE